MRDLNDVKQSMGTESPFGSGKAAIVLENCLYDRFIQATHDLLTAMENLIDELPETRPGPQNKPVFQLVSELDNDMEFALAVFRIADEKFKRETSAGTVENAVKKIVKERISSSRK